VVQITDSMKKRNLEKLKEDEENKRKFVDLFFNELLLFEESGLPPIKVNYCKMSCDNVNSKVDNQKLKFKDVYLLKNLLKERKEAIRAIKK